MYAQRCRRTRQHGPHYVKPRGSWTGFTCAGHPSAAEIERQLTEAFGPE
jgi:hypothetical protein